MRSLLFFVLFCALAPIWISQREMWDGVSIEYAFETLDLSGLFHAVTASGWLIAGWIYKLMWFLQREFSIPYWMSIDVLYTLALLGMAYEVLKLSDQRLSLGRNASQMALIIFLAHPVWHFLMSGIHMVHMTGFWFLLLGHRLTTEKSAASQTFGWMLVTLGFQFPASIVMIFWLEGIFFWQAHKNRVHNVKRAMFVALYACAWYVASRTIFGPIQTFDGYNQILLPTSFEALRMIAWTGLKFASWVGVLGAPVWIACVWSHLSKRSSGQRHIRLAGFSWTNTTSTFGVLLLGCMVAMAPYWAVGKGPVVAMPYDWTARNALPLALPFSILMAVIIEKLMLNTVVINAGRTKEKHLLMWIIFWWLSMTILGIGGKLCQIRLEKAIEVSLRELAAPPSGLVTLQLPFDPLVRIRHNEANGILWRAYGRAQWAVLVSPPASWAQLIRQSYVGEQPTAVINVKNLELWSKFYVMGDLKKFDCETTIRFTQPIGEQDRPFWLRLMSSSSFQLIASLDRTSCP